MIPDLWTDYLREMYQEPIRRQMNDATLRWSLNDPNYVYVRPPWYKRVRYSIRRRISRIRIAAANRLAGFDVEDRWD
jgi:hypothetical protein